MLFGDKTVELLPGEMFIVPKWVEYCPKADEENKLLLFETLGTKHTGNAIAEKTKKILNFEFEYFFWLYKILLFSNSWQNN